MWKAIIWAATERCSKRQDVYKRQINILDISQTIIDGYFNMMMITDTSRSEKKLDQISAELSVLGEEIGVMKMCIRDRLYTEP